MWKILLIITFISCSQKTRLTENIDLNGTWEADGVYTITFNPNAKFKISFDEIEIITRVNKNKKGLTLF